MANHKLYTLQRADAQGQQVCLRCGLQGADLQEGDPCRPMTPEQQAKIEQQNAADRRAWTSYALANPEVPVH